MVPPPEAYGGTLKDPRNAPLWDTNLFLAWSGWLMLLLFLVIRPLVHRMKLSFFRKRQPAVPGRTRPSNFPVGSLEKDIYSAPHPLSQTGDRPVDHVYPGKYPPLLTRSGNTKRYTAIGAQGIWLTVTDGTNTWKVLDASGGAAVSNIGHGNQRVLQAEFDFGTKTGIAYAASLTLDTQVALDFAAFLLRSTCYMMAQVVGFYCSGSEATEAAIKLAIQFHQKNELNTKKERNWIIARKQSYHGATISALGISGHMARRRLFEEILPEKTAFLPPCNAYRMAPGMTAKQYVQLLAQQLEDKILALGPENVAAFFAEPVVGAALGCAPAVEGYLAAMKKVCRRHGVLFVLDEVMCGMGRTGYIHAWQGEAGDVVPDIQIVGKGLAGGYAAISAVLIGDDVASVMQSGFSHGHTFQNLPKSCQVGLEVQAIIEEGRLVERVLENGEVLRQMLAKRLGCKYIGDIRGRGYFWGIEFVRDTATKEPFSCKLNIASKLHELGLTREHGVFVYPGSGTVDGIDGDHIIVAPAFDISDDEMAEMVERIGKLVDTFFDDLDMEGQTN